MIGTPTGTSEKFASMMATAVTAYFEKHNLTLKGLTVIPLEGEGRVEARVEKLYNNLVNKKDWVEAIRKADAVFIATHSQGALVSTFLLEKLLSEGLTVGSRSMLLCMAGIMHGPCSSFFYHTVIAKATFIQLHP